MHKAVNRDSALLAGGNSVNGKAWTGVAVAPGKYIGLIGLISKGICYNGLIAVKASGATS